MKTKAQQREVLTMCDGYQPLRDANKLLKARGLVLRWRKRSPTHGEAGGDQVWLRLTALDEEE